MNRKKMIISSTGPSYRELENTIGYEFSDKQLLQRAMTHQSALDVGDFIEKGNQRLEFLGDRVLGLVIAEYLFSQSKNFSEGQLAPRLNMLVSKQACARAAEKINLGKYIVMGLQESASGGRLKISILGDACEALIAAIYRDGGIEAARQFILDVWAEQIAEVYDSSCVKDPKTLLQEFVQARQGKLPVYKLVRRDGPDHKPEFTVELKVMGWTSIGVAFSKQEAERVAARVALQELTREFGEL